jgi:hypothetical protein
MPKEQSLKNETGNKYGRLKVIERAPHYSKDAYWKCKCECGNEIIARGSHLRKGYIQSCGCLRKSHLGEFTKTHGKTNTRLYHIWINIKYRCNSKTSQAYPMYGGRGIKLFKEWQNNFEAFEKWAINNGYTDDLSIDRINVNGNYEPLNCRWATNVEQMNNRRCNRNIEYNGEIKTLSEWNKTLGKSEKFLASRLRYGYSMEEAMTIPYNQQR